MGRAKLDHLRAILADPQVLSQWIAVKGAAPDEADVNRLYERLAPMMAAAAAKTSLLIPGAAQAAADLTALGVRLASGTGYTRQMMADIIPRAAEQGYRPEVVICADETPTGRPAPFMTWQALIAVEAWPARACIKVDDAAVGIEEGRLAGCWTVGLSASGNGIGLDLESYRALDPQDRRLRLAQSEAALREAGADFVVEDISNLMPVVREIARRIGT
jgi:phosphonoacetaldehyde hydrolase